MFDLSIWWRIVIFLGGMTVGFIFLLKPLQIVTIIGKSAWAEQSWPGGTFGAVKAFGIFIMVVAILILING
jgi:hypothetical protein